MISPLKNPILKPNYHSMLNPIFLDRDFYLPIFLLFFQLFLSLFQSPLLRAYLQFYHFLFIFLKFIILDFLDFPLACHHKITAYVDGREFEMLCVLIFVSGMFVGGVLAKLCCRSVQVVIDSRSQHESMRKKSARDVSVEVNEMIPPVFPDWLDMRDTYYQTEKGTVLHLTPFCSYAKGRALSRFHFCKKCLKTRREESPKQQSGVDT